ncbi:MAG: hypothetical protein M3Y72_03860 [Acidobacteriota bacterium]|nr:hypothetical protein [Acidobacteriota bacterium]
MPKRLEAIKAFVKAKSELLYYVGYGLLIITFFAKDSFRDSLKDKIQDQSAAIDRHKAATKRIEDKEAAYAVSARFEQSMRPQNQEPDLTYFARALSHKLEQALMYVSDAVEFAKEAPDKKLLGEANDLEQQSRSTTSISYQLIHQIALMNSGNIPHPVGDAETKYMTDFNRAVHSEIEIMNSSVKLTNDIEENIHKAQESERAQLTKIGIFINVVFCLGWLIGLIGHISGVRELPRPT